jgi:hypothetical protein
LKFIKILTLSSDLSIQCSQRIQLASRLMGHDTMAAARTIRRIIASVDDHGVIDVFSKYEPQELISSIYALSRIQAACQRYNRSKLQPNGEDGFPTKDLLDDLVHYAPYATAAYGWRMDLATAGRLHLGDLQAIVKMTKIDPDDVVTVNWESRANQPVRVRYKQEGPAIADCSS